MRRSSVLGLSGGGFHRVAYVEWGDSAAPRTVVCVHGLTRCGRDFDALGQVLATRGFRVVCPDLPGRGESDWLAQPAEYDFPTYLADMTVLLARLGVDSVDWVGTSLGGLIGMALAARPGSPIRRLVVNDIGAFVDKAGLERIRGYVGLDMHFPTRAAAEARLRELLASFGPLSPMQFKHLADISLKPGKGGGVRFHYDPAIGDAMRATPAADLDLWPLWEAVTCPVLLLRGADSDLLSAQTADAMTRRGTACRLVTWDGVGHAPALLAAEQIAVVADWLRDTAAPAAAEGKPPAPPMDVEALRTLFGEALPEAMSLFLDTARAVSAELPRVLATRDADAVWAAAHKLVGSSRMAGAVQLLAACEAACTAVKAADWPEAEAAAARIIAEVAAVGDWIARWRDGDGTAR